MAADLKANLKKLISTAGKKKFFFAYGLGKRKDKKGEGELIVRTKRPKKVEAEGELAEPGDIFEGVCWSGSGPDDAGTIYFKSKGKKLSTQLMVKMKTTAKNAVGQIHDFQLPSPQEEARADALSEEETDEVVSEEPDGSTTAPVPSPPPSANVPTPPPSANRPPSAPPPVPTAPQPSKVPTAPPQPDGGADVIKRLNAMGAGIKTAMAGPQKARVQALVVTTNGLIKNKDYGQANRTLDELDAILATTSAPPSPPPLAPEGGADVVRRLNAISGNIKAALAGPGKARVQNLVVSVNGAIKNKDFATAESALTELESLVKQAPPPPPVDPAEAMRAEWFRRMVAIEPRVLQAQKTRATEANWAILFKSIQDIGNARKFEQALKAVDDLEARLNAPPPPPPPPPPIEMESETSEAEFGEETSTENAEAPESDASYSPFAESESESAEEPEYAGGADEAIPEAPPLPETSADDQVPEAPPYPDTAEEETTETQSDELSQENQYESAYRELLAKLESGLSRLSASNPDAAAPIQQSVDYAKTYAQGGDFTNAYAWLDQADQALASLPATETDESQSEQPANDDASAYSSRLKKLEAALQKLRTDDPDAAAPIQQSIDYAEAFAQGGDYTNALAWLDQADQALATAPGSREEEQEAEVEQEAQAPPEQTTPPNEEVEQEAELDETEASPEQTTPNEEVEQEVESVEEETEEIQTPISPEEEVRQKAGKNLVAIAKAKLAWQAARKDAAARVQAYLNDVLSDPDLLEDPRFPEVKDSISKAGTALNGFDDSLIDALDEASGSHSEDPAARARATKKVLDLLNNYRTEVANNPMIEAIDDGTYGPGQVGATLLTTIDNIAAEISKN